MDKSSSSIFSKTNKFYSLFSHFRTCEITRAGRLTLPVATSRGTACRLENFLHECPSEIADIFLSLGDSLGGVVCARVSVRMVARVRVAVTRARSLVCLYLCRLVDTVLSRGRVRVERGAATVRVHVKVDVRTREEPHGVCTVAGKHCNPVTLRLRGLVAALGCGGGMQAGERGPSGGCLGRKA